MKFGDFEIHSVLDGFFRLDGGAMFGRVPKEVWKKTNPPDRQNRILMALSCLLIRTGKYNILVDTGAGDRHPKELVRLLAIDRRKINLCNSLKYFGLTFKDIDIVVNTHLHFDHCGGNVEYDDGKFTPRFKKYIIQKGEWRDATTFDYLTRGSYSREFLPAEDCRFTEFVKDDVVEIEKGITLIKTGGHTSHHQIVKIESEGQTAFFLGDLVPLQSHLKYSYVMAYDVFPQETVRKKIEILSFAAEHNSLLIFGHDPIIASGYAKIRNNKIWLAKTERF